MDNLCLTATVCVANGVTVLHKVMNKRLSGNGNGVCLQSIQFQHISVKRLLMMERLI